MRIQRTTLVVLALPFLLAIFAAYIQWLTVGLPSVPQSPQFFSQAHPQGFPFWIGITHYINLTFIILLIRSGLQILVDHPRLYWNVHCTPGTEWIRFTPVAMPTGTAKEDARYLSPLIGLPGGRHTLGMSRHCTFSVSYSGWVMARSILDCYLPLGSGEDWCRPHGTFCPTLGLYLFITLPSTCRKSLIRSTTTMHFSNCHIW